MFAAAFLLLPRAEKQPLLLFFFRLLLFGSSPFGLWWGWSCWWLLDGAVEVAGRWSCCGEATVALLLSMQRREPLFFSFFLFFC